MALLVGVGVQGSKVCDDLVDFRPGKCVDAHAIEHSALLRGNDRKRVSVAKRVAAACPFDASFKKHEHNRAAAGIAAAIGAKKNAPGSSGILAEQRKGSFRP